MTDLRLTTDRMIRALQPAMRYDVPDSLISNLVLRVRPDGVKVWSLRYRANGQQRRLRLGEYPRVSLAKARQWAQVELRKVDAGHDPQGELRAARAAAEAAKADSIEALCERYLTKHAKVKKRSWRDDQSKIAREILPRWKHRPVSSITRKDCIALIEAIDDRGAPIYANRVAALLSKLFAFAMSKEIITANPAWKLPKPGVEAAQRPAEAGAEKAYTADEIRIIWQNVEGLPAAVRAIIRLQLITGQRPSEVRDLAWAEITGDWWTIPGRRTKNKRDHRVYLTALALETLENVPHIANEALAFAGWRGKRQWAELNRQVFAGVRRRLKPRHALRDTVATGLAEAKVPTEHISRVLNHAYGPKVTAGYNAYAYDREKTRALKAWDRQLRAILTDKPASKIVAFSR